MNAFLVSRPRPLNLAHRGASAYAPENTLAAFRLAAEMGADGLELDAKLSRDGAIVILHDATVDRTPNGTGRVSDSTLAELKRLDAGSKFDPKFAGERIPTLGEVFDAVGDRLVINVELTNYTSRNDGLEYKVIELIGKSDLADRVMVSSFSPLSLRKVKRAAPHVVCGLLVAPDMPIFLRRAWLAPLIPHLDARHPQHSMIDAAFVRKTHARGQKVNTWTVNEEADMRRLIGAGVDAIMTDRPDALQRILAG
ncbi:MAG TPA: glycerophosphodiester phosphodiesterase [Anaerolineae bacterium]